MRIEISTMKGEIPRLEPHLLPNEAASLALDCTYERGVVAPMRSDQEHGTLATSVTGHAVLLCTLTLVYLHSTRECDC